MSTHRLPLHRLTRYVAFPAVGATPAEWEAECVCGRWDEWHEMNLHLLIEGIQAGYSDPLNE